MRHVEGKTTWADQQALYDRWPLEYLSPCAEDWRRTAPYPYCETEDDSDEFYAELKARLDERSPA